MRTLGVAEILVIVGILVLFLGARHAGSAGAWMGRSVRTMALRWRGLSAPDSDRDRESGRRWAAAFEQRFRTVADPRLIELATKLARAAGLADPVPVRMVEEPAFNAFAIPGGHVYLTSRLADRVRHEDELAAVIAHEFAHLALGHAATLRFRSRALGWLAIPLSLVRGPHVWLLRKLFDLGSVATSRMYSRDFELEADRTALRYLAGAGFDPSAMVRLLERLARLEVEEASLVAGLLGTHPPAADRARNARELVRETVVCKER